MLPTLNMKTWATLHKNNVIDRLITWRRDDPRFNNKGKNMQAQYTLEIRFNALSEERHEAMQGFMRDLAVFANTTASLLGHSKPQVVMYSDHAFLGHEDIPLLADNMGKGLVELLRRMGVETAQAEVAAPSDELLQAMVDHEKAG